MLADYNGGYSHEPRDTLLSQQSYTVDESMLQNAMRGTEVKVLSNPFGHQQDLNQTPNWQEKQSYMNGGSEIDYKFTAGSQDQNAFNQKKTGNQFFVVNEQDYSKLPAKIREQYDVRPSQQTEMYSNYSYKPSATGANTYGDFKFSTTSDLGIARDLGILNHGQKDEVTWHNVNDGQLDKIEFNNINVDDLLRKHKADTMNSSSTAQARRPSITITDPNNNVRTEFVPPKEQHDYYTGRESEYQQKQSYGAYNGAVDSYGYAGTGYNYQNNNSHVQESAKKSSAPAQHHDYTFVNHDQSASKNYDMGGRLSAAPTYQEQDVHTQDFYKPYGGGHTGDSQVVVSGGLSQYAGYGNQNATNSNQYSTNSYQYGGAQDYGIHPTTTTGYSTGGYDANYGNQYNNAGFGYGAGVTSGKVNDSHHTAEFQNSNQGLNVTTSDNFRSAIGDKSSISFKTAQNFDDKSGFYDAQSLSIDRQSGDLGSLLAKFDNAQGDNAGKKDSISVINKVQAGRSALTNDDITTATTKDESPLGLRDRSAKTQEYNVVAPKRAAATRNVKSGLARGGGKGPAAVSTKKEIFVEKVVIKEEVIQNEDIDEDGNLKSGSSGKKMTLRFKKPGDLTTSPQGEYKYDDNKKSGYLVTDMISPTNTGAAKRIKNQNAIFRDVEDDVVGFKADLGYSEDSTRKQGRKTQQVFMRSETPNKKMRASRVKDPQQDQDELDPNSQFKLTQENLAAYQSLYKAHDPMSKLQMQDDKKKFMSMTGGDMVRSEFLQGVTSVKSFALEQQSPSNNRRKNYETYSAVSRPRATQSMVWDLSNSAGLKQSLISASNGREPFVELQRVPVLSYCFDKYKSSRKF
jgi:hypothetical protein